MKIHKGLLLIVLTVLLWLVGRPVAADQGGMALFGRSIVLERGQNVNGDVALFAGSIEVAPDVIVRGDLAVIGGSARLDGTIEGDVVVIGGNLVMGPQAWIQGDVVALGSLRRDPAARIDGDIVAGAQRTAPFWRQRFNPTMLPTRFDRSSTTGSGGPGVSSRSP